VDNTGNIITNYDEDKSVYIVNASEVKSGCGNGIALVSKEDFHSGRVLDMEASYSEVGDVNFTITEQIDSEYAVIDRDDTTDEMRLVDIGSVSGISFVASSFGISWDFEDYNVV